MKLNNSNVITCFKMYQKDDSKINSTIFDLIDGDGETKQTKALAYILKSHPNFLQKFLSIPQIESTIKQVLQNKYKDFEKCDFIQFDAEMLSVGAKPVRRDITLTFYNNKIKLLVVVIEAKSAKLGNVHDIQQQLDSYFNPCNFPEDKDIPKCGISLTKYNHIFNDNEFISITWKDIIDILYYILKDNKSSSPNLLKEYYQFITEVDKNMNYYEKEILSVPAGGTYEEIKKFNVHACPNTPSYAYKTPLFITFRSKNGGVMEALYKIDDIFVLNPNNESQIEALKYANLSYYDRLSEYISKRKVGHGFNKGDEYRFYILSEKEKILLPHKPHPSINNAGGWYYKLSEILSVKSIVEVDK